MRKDKWLLTFEYTTRKGTYREYRRFLTEDGAHEYGKGLLVTRPDATFRVDERNSDRI